MKNFDEIEINADVMDMHSPVMIKRNKDVINKGNELTGIKENFADLEIDMDLLDILNKSKEVKR
jgi:hypothetical protein